VAPLGENNANRKWIYVELDPAAIGVNRPIDVPLVGDLRTVVPQLTEALKDSPRKASPDLARWIEEDKKRLVDLAESAPNREMARCTRRVGWSKRPRRSRKTAFMFATAAAR
jgi:thiamine pyrophosphate-dependent acetolactate synthase large subunit-like protein